MCGNHYMDMLLSGFRFAVVDHQAALLLQLLYSCCVAYTTRTSRLIYDQLTLARFTRSVRPSVHCAFFGLPSPPARRPCYRLGAGQSAGRSGRAGGRLGRAPVSAMSASVAITLGAVNLLRAASK